MPGLVEFYTDRIKAARNYGILGASELVEVVERCAQYDKAIGNLSLIEYQHIMKAADDLFYDILTGGISNEEH